MSSERVAVFIDGANMFHALIKDCGRIDIDYVKLVNKLVGDRKLVRAYFYSALPDQREDPDRYSKQQRFLDALRDKPYFSVKLGRLVKRDDKYVEKGVDVAIAVDMLHMAFQDSYDTAILMSGDGDLAMVVEVVARSGRHVENVATKSIHSKHLRQTCDVSTILDDDFLEDCWQ